MGPHSEKALFTRGTRGLNESFVQLTHSLQTERSNNLPSKGESICPDGGAEGAVGGLTLPVSPICWHYVGT